MIICYDSYCKLCTTSSRLWKKLDWQNRLKFASFRDLPDYPPIMEEKLHVYDRDRWYQGFTAILRVSRKLPLMWPVLPFLYALKLVGLGDFFYRIVAKNRKLVPINHCKKGNCHIKSH